MGIELPPELADVAAQTGVKWPEADEEAMGRSAQAWRDAATSMTTLTTDADTTARATLSTVSGVAAEAAADEWKKFVEPDSGLLTSAVRGCTDAADRLEHAANQVGQAKVEIVRNLVALAQNQDAANAVASTGYPFALAGLDAAVQGTAANVAHIESQLVSAVQPGAGVDLAGLQNPVNANPGPHLLAGLTTTVGELPDTLAPGVTTTAGETVQTTTDTLNRATDLAPGTTTGGSPHSLVAGVTDALGSTTTGQGQPGLVGDVVRDATNLADDTAADLTGRSGQPGLVGDVVRDATDLADDTTGDPGGLPGVVGGATDLVGDTASSLVGGSATHGPPDGLPDLVEPPGNTRPGDPGQGSVLPVAPDDLPPGHADITGPVPIDDFPTPPTGQTYQAGFAGGLEPSAAPPANLPPAAPPGPAAPPAYGGAPNLAGGPNFGAPAFGGGAPAPGAPPVPPTAAPPAGVPAPRPAAVAPTYVTPDRPVADQPAPRKPIAGPPGAPPPLRGETDQVLAAFWIHMFPIGHLPVASYRPARQLPPPPEELDYAAGLRFEPGDHPKYHVVDGMPRLRELQAAKDTEPVDPDAKTVPNLKPVQLSPGLPADDPAVAPLLDGHDPVGGGHERDWDRRYLVRLGSVTAQGISPEGLEYNWPTSEQYPEGGSAPGEAEMLDADTVIDRFGGPDGRVFAADGTPFAQRSLPPAHKDSGYRRYRVVKPLPVWRAVSAAWFGQPGGGVRYRTTHTATELVALGYLEELL